MLELIGLEVPTGIGRVKIRDDRGSSERSWVHGSEVGSALVLDEVMWEKPGRLRGCHGSIGLIRQAGCSGEGVSSLGSSLRSESRRHVTEGRSEDGLDAAPAASSELVQSLITTAHGRADGSEGRSGRSLIVKAGDTVAVRDIRSEMLGECGSRDARSVTRRKNGTERFGSIGLHQVGKFDVVA